ncbi:hypothetical protein RJT34_12605 [Clitoria ternatea]|uniref:Uncharacterized protein n=1 Tax=Clitoria ternatea TaxID=43366 RepID=A0AAN9JMH4_CLITE
MAFVAPSGLCISFFFCLTSLLLFSTTARNPIFFSNQGASSIVGRSLKVINLEDYDEVTANRGHDPWHRASGGGNSGRKG